MQHDVGPAGENDDIDHALAKTAINNNALYHPTTSPLPQRRTDNCVTTAEDVSDFTYKF